MNQTREESKDQGYSQSGHPIQYSSIWRSFGKWSRAQKTSEYTMLNKIIISAEVIEWNSATCKNLWFLGTKEFAIAV